MIAIELRYCVAVDEHQARILAKKARYEETEAAHQAARDEIVDAIIAALRAGKHPTEVSEWSPFSDTYVRGLARKHGIPDYLLRRYPSARGWLERNFPSWPAAAAALAALNVGLEDQEYTGGVLWQGLRRGRGRAGRRRAITTELARWATRPGADRWTRQYADADELAAAISEVLDQHLP
jgi:hypothetical protein